MPVTTWRRAGDAPRGGSRARCDARNMRSLNETACQALLEDVRWDEPVSLISLAILALIDVLVIAGKREIYVPFVTL